MRHRVPRAQQSLGINTEAQRHSDAERTKKSQQKETKETKLLITDLIFISVPLRLCDSVFHSAMR